MSDVVSWYTSHSLILHVKKTNELIFDFSKSTPYHEPLTIQGCDVEICNQFKYLGVVIDDQLSWSYYPGHNKNCSSYACLNHLM